MRLPLVTTAATHGGSGKRPRGVPFMVPSCNLKLLTRLCLDLLLSHLLLLKFCLLRCVRCCAARQPKLSADTRSPPQGAPHEAWDIEDVENLEGRHCGALENITPFSPSMAAREARLRPCGPA
jgi:hypothetical protein